MGTARWADEDWKGYSTRNIKGKSLDMIYTSSKLKQSLDPKGVKVRESRDSKENPNSNAIIVGLDVTGSMEPVLDAMIRTGLPTLFTEIYSRKPVTDPHIMVMGIGDVEWDHAPLQVSQFEADIKLADQLRDVYVEKGGGGNSFESYILPWYFASQHTSLDCFEKRGKKGYLFTIGDEEPTPRISAAKVKQFVGDVTQDLVAENLLKEVSKMYEVYHIMIEQGNHFRRFGDEVVQAWVKLLGQRAIRLSDASKVAEVIVSAISVNEGANKKSIIESWKGATSKVVKEAIKDLPVGGVVRM